jgi:hypothetical protein
MTGEEILDSGVQVMAQPPGKKNQTIHLLSGGEKALTAIALVFAIFQLNPAPFCLLDEVDAPLDDANTERYAKLVTSHEQGHPVPVHQPQQDRDGDGRAADRRDHAGAGRLAHRGGGHGVGRCRWRKRHEEAARKRSPMSSFTVGVAIIGGLVLAVLVGLERLDPRRQATRQRHAGPADHHPRRPCPWSRPRPIEPTFDDERLAPLAHAGAQARPGRD